MEKNPPFWISNRLAFNGSLLYLLYRLYLLYFSSISTTKNGKTRKSGLWNIVPLFGSGCNECRIFGVSHCDYILANAT